MKTFRDFIKEAKGKGKVVRFVAFDILKDEIKVFSTNADNGVDIIDKKLKTAKFKDVLNKLKILRHTEDGTEDVTSLFINKN